MRHALDHPQGAAVEETGSRKTEEKRRRRNPRTVTYIQEQTARTRTGVVEERSTAAVLGNVLIHEKTDNTERQSMQNPLTSMYLWNTNGGKILRMALDSFRSLRFIPSCRLALRPRKIFVLVRLIRQRERDI